MNILLGVGADPNVPWPCRCEHTALGCICNGGQRPLHTAIRTNSNEVISPLLASGASPFAKDARGITPIELAISTRNPGTIALFGPYIATWIGRGLISVVSRMIVRTPPSLNTIMCNFGC